VKLSVPQLLMPSRQLDPNRSSNADRLKLLLRFLTASVLLRCVHLWLIPSLLTGMNPAAAVSAKGVVAEGLAGLDPSKPPLPALLLSVPAWLLDVPPGRLIHPAVLVVSLAHASFTCDL
jgi:hypothetical protein